MQLDQTGSEGTEVPETVDTTFLDRSVQRERNLFNLNKSLFSDIANKSDIAARNRKLSAYGCSAVEVNNEVVCDILKRIATGETFGGIVAELVNGRIVCDADNPGKEAISIAIGLLCNKHAQKIIYRIAKERPSGDASDVMGEEVQKEQESISQEEATKSADRSMLAVLSKVGRHRGVHRADVYGVADFSRGAMRDNFTRMVSNQSEEVTSFLLDWLSAIWTPSTETQQMAWNLAFQGKSVCNVLFGMNPTTGAHPTEQHFSELSDEEDDKRRQVYPVAFPYKPLKVRFNARTRPKDVDAAHRRDCGKCGHMRLSNPWSARAAKLGLSPKWGKNCPPGVVTQWRKVLLGSLLPESASSGTDDALRRALRDFGRFVRTERTRLIQEDSDKMVVKGLVRAFREDRCKVGEGQYPVEWDYVADTARPVRHGIYRTWWTNEATGGKDRKRFAYASHNLFPTHQDDPDFRILSDEEHIDDVWEFTLANGIPGERIKLPVGRNRSGVDRDDMIRDMLDGWVQISRSGNMVVEGIEGTFVQGLHGVIEHQRFVQNGRKFLKWLIANRGIFALSLCGRYNGE